MSGPDAPIVVSPGAVSLDEFARVLAGEAVVLNPMFWPRVEAASDIVAQAAGAQAPVYGINTGFGKLASKRIPPDQTTLLQRNLILSHCCGVGPPISGPGCRPSPSATCAPSPGDRSSDGSVASTPESPGRTSAAASALADGGPPTAK